MKERLQNPVPALKTNDSTDASKSRVPCSHTCLVQDTTDIKGPFGCITDPDIYIGFPKKRTAMGASMLDEPSLKAKVNARFK